MMKSKKQLTNTTNSMDANKIKSNLFLWVCFIAYLLLLGYMLFYSPYFGREGHATYRYNLNFLQEISRFYMYGMRTGNWDLFVLNVCGNIAVFIPIGLFLPKLLDSCKRFVLTTVLALELSFFIEIIQLVTRVGSFDVDDLFLNTIGAVCGFIIYKIFHGLKMCLQKNK